MNDAEMSQAFNERHPETLTARLPESAIGETNPHTGHMVIDQRGTGRDAVVLAWRAREGKADYAVWRLFVTFDGRRGYDAGDYYQGQGALLRAAKAFRER